MLQTLIDLLPALLVDEGLGLLPGLIEVFHFFYTSGIAHL